MTEINIGKLKVTSTFRGDVEQEFQIAKEPMQVPELPQSKREGERLKYVIGEVKAKDFIGKVDRVHYDSRNLNTEEDQHFYAFSIKGETEPEPNLTKQDSEGSMLAGGQSSELVENYESEIMEFTVGPDKQEIEFEECRIVFSAGTFDEPSIIKMSTDVDPSHWPNDYIGISPLLNVSSSKPLKKPAKIKMSTWCTGDGSEKSKIVTLDVLHKPNQHSWWEVINTQPLKNYSRKVKFCYQEFSPFLLGLREYFFGPQKITITGFICAKQQRVFYLAFYKDHESLIKKAKAIGGSSDPLFHDFSSESYTANSDVQVKLHVENLDLQFQKNKFDFKIDPDFFRESVKRFNSRLFDPNNQITSPQRAHIKCEITNVTEGTKIPECLLDHMWLPDTPVTATDHPHSSNQEPGSVAAFQIASGGGSAQTTIEGSRLNVGNTGQVFENPIINQSINILNVPSVAQGREYVSQILDAESSAQSSSGASTSSLRRIRHEPDQSDESPARKL